MFANKYGKFLTVLLIIVIIILLAGVGFIAYKVVKQHKDNKEIVEAISDFDTMVQNNNNVEEQETPKEEENLVIDPTTEEKKDTNSSNNKKTYYKGYVMIGYITIPKTGVQLPILDEVSAGSLDTAVAALYPSNPKLNEPGNVVIVGHNYRNGSFFSNNEKLSTGDIIKVKDLTGRELTYKIYEIFQTTPEDASFYARNTNGATEITLSTCTDDSSARLIIFARAN